MWAPDSQQHHGAVFASQYAALQAHEAACQPAQGARAPTQHSRPPLPSAPTAGPHAQAHAKTLQHSSLTLSLQAAGHGGQPALVPAAAGGRAPPPPHHALPPYLAQPAQAQAQLFAGGAWHAAYAAQVQQAAASQQLQQAAYGLAAGTAACHAFADPYGGAQAAATAAAVAAAAGWPAMQPHNSLALLHAQAQAAQAQAAALQQGQLGGGAAAVQQHSRRVRRRRGTARRSLLNLFDAVAASEEQSHSEGSDFESDSERRAGAGRGLPGMLSWGRWQATTGSQCAPASPRLAAFETCRRRLRHGAVQPGLFRVLPQLGCLPSLRRRPRRRPRRRRHALARHARGGRRCVAGALSLSVQRQRAQQPRGRAGHTWR